MPNRMIPGNEKTIIQQPLPVPPKTDDLPLKSEKEIAVSGARDMEKVAREVTEQDDKDLAERQGRTIPVTPKH